MSNTYSNGLQITPLALWITAGLGGALWAILFAVGMSILAEQRSTRASVSTLVTSQAYDRREIDSIKTDVKAVQSEVRSISDRLGKVEAR